MSVVQKGIFKVISYHQGTVLGAPQQKNYKLFYPRSNMQTKKLSLHIGDLMHTTIDRAVVYLAKGP